MVKKIAVKDAENMGLTAGALFAQALGEKPAPLVVLPAGLTPLPFYQALVARYRSGERGLNRFTYLQLDEYRGLPPDDRRLFASWLGREILDPLEVPPERRLTFESLAPDPGAEARRMETLIAQYGGIDLAILGLGVNGHIGFNEPGSPPDCGVRTITLTPQTQETNAAYWDGTEEVPYQAYTLGLGTLRQARRIVLLASGARKAEILDAALRGPVSPALPASFLQGHPALTVIADEDALSAMPPV